MSRLLTTVLSQFIDELRRDNEADLAVDPIVKQSFDAVVQVVQNYQDKIPDLSRQQVSESEASELLSALTTICMALDHFIAVSAAHRDELASEAAAA